MKICSLLPSATEILFALGLGDQVAGVSHECDFPLEAKSKPVLIKSRISHTESAAAIDRQVREFLERGESLYSVDFEKLRPIEPDLIVTQDLCHVCAATPDDLGAALAHLERQPRVVTLNPHSLADVCADIRTVGEATGRADRANEVVAEFERGIAKRRAIRCRARSSARPVSRMARSAVRGGALGAGNGGARGRGRRSRAPGQTVVPRGVGNCAGDAARSDCYHAVRLQSCGGRGGISQSAVAARLERFAGGSRWPRFCRRSFRLFFAAGTTPGRGAGGSGRGDPRGEGESPAAVRIRCSSSHVLRAPLILRTGATFPPRTPSFCRLNPKAEASPKAFDRTTEGRTSSFQLPCRKVRPEKISTRPLGK